MLACRDGHLISIPVPMKRKLRSFKEENKQEEKKVEEDEQEEAEVEEPPPKRAKIEPVVQYWFWPEDCCSYSLDYIQHYVAGLTEKNCKTPGGRHVDHLP